MRHALVGIFFFLLNVYVVLGCGLFWVKICKWVLGQNGLMTPLYCDNQSTIRLAENPVFHARTKHVEVHYHFVREKVLQEEIELSYVKTDNQVADLFTKGLSTTKLEKFCSQLRIVKRFGVGIEGEC